MKILFVHQNFPGQFKALAPELVRRGHEVSALTPRVKEPATMAGVRVLPYRIDRGSAPGVHPWVADFEAKAIRGEAFFRAAHALARDGYAPDVVVAHPGWGESLFVKDAWPRARLGIYCEFHYGVEDTDVGFDAEFGNDDPGDPCRLRLKTINNLLHFVTADGGLSPTRWQADTFPEPFRSRIAVVHDGIDTRALAPDPRATITLSRAGGGEPIVMRHGDEVVTFVNRNLEPYRGYHVFMRALPELLRRRPNARVVLVGGDSVSYGAPPPKGTTWKQRFIDEVRPRIPDADWARVHFVGNLAYPDFLSLLRVSAAHVYLTYPFVLSWSLLEAMSLGCAIVASDVAPVREAITHDETGRLVGFFDGDALVRETCGLLEDPAMRARLGTAAREFVRGRYDLASVCLPGQAGWVEGLGG